MFTISHDPTRLRVRVRPVDLDGVRRSLTAMEALCREARASSDCRVVLSAIAVLRRRVAEITELLG